MLLFGERAPEPAHVFWHIAALVTDSGRRSFAAELFHFGKAPRPLEAELFLLSPGEYELTLALAGTPSSLPVCR